MFFATSSEWAGVVERLERQVFLPLHSVERLAEVFRWGGRKTLTSEPGSRWIWWM